MLQIPLESSGIVGKNFPFDLWIKALHRFEHSYEEACSNGSSRCNSFEAEDLSSNGNNSDLLPNVNTATRARIITLESVKKAKVLVSAQFGCRLSGLDPQME